MAGVKCTENTVRDACSSFLFFVRFSPLLFRSFSLSNFEPTISSELLRFSCFFLFLSFFFFIIWMTNNNNDHAPNPIDTRSYNEKTCRFGTLEKPNFYFSLISSLVLFSQ